MPRFYEHLHTHKKLHVLQHSAGKEPCTFRYHVSCLKVIGSASLSFRLESKGGKAQKKLRKPILHLSLV